MSLRAVSMTFGMRVMPPTSTSSSMSFSESLASFRQCLDRLDGALEERIGELLELRARQLLLNVLRSGLIGGDERQIDLVFLRGGERDLGLLGFFLDALDGVGLLGEIDAAVSS